MAETLPTGPWPFLNSDIDTTDKSFFAFAHSHYPVAFGFYIATCALAVIGVILSVAHQPLGSIPLFFSLPYIVIFWAIVNGKMGKDFAQHLAGIMGYSFTEAAPLASVAGDMFRAGHDQEISDVLSGTYQGLPIRLFQFKFVTGYGKSQQTHVFVIAEFQFSHPIPPMRVVRADPSLSEIVLDDRAIDVHASSPVKISLEGDFNKYFSVYAPENTQIEDLEIMSPDFMAFLIDHYDIYKDIGFECHDTRLYIHQTGSLDSKRIKDLSTIYSLGNTLIPKIQKIKI
jgi:hypothetical protein